MYIFIYLDHIGGAEPELRRDDFAVHQHFSLLKSSRIFSACDHIQQSDTMRKNIHVFIWGCARV